MSESHKKEEGQVITGSAIEQAAMALENLGLEYLSGIISREDYLEQKENLSTGSPYRTERKRLETLLKNLENRFIVGEISRSSFAELWEKYYRRLQEEPLP